MKFTIEYINDDGIVGLLDSENPQWRAATHINNPILLGFISEDEKNALLADKSEEKKAEWLANWVREFGPSSNP